MQQYNISKGIKGFWRLYNYGLRLRTMVQDIAQHRTRILTFWQKHGLDATTEAFKVSRRTLYVWKAKLTAGGGQLSALNSSSKRPHTVRLRQWHPDILVELKRLRRLHPNLGKEKIHVLLQPFCQQRNIRCPKPRTIGRLIADQPDKLRLFPRKLSHFGKVKPQKRQPKQRKPKHFVATHPGHCGSFDTVERFVNGCRRYIITFTDVYSRFAFAYATTSHGSLAATEFFTVIRQVFPYQLEYILTDNGSEFMKHFDHELKRLHRTHWHTYPKTPKMNAHVERFNRTIQEEFVDYHVPALQDPIQFNDEMVEYLLWYNAERPHWSLNLQSPIQFLLNEHPECRMWWPNTKCCFFLMAGV